jgi:1,4-alpha-glucan branching enzyme
MAVPNDGMGSLLYTDGSGTCRFRVWAPFAASVSLEGDFTNWGVGAIPMGSEGNGNWSCVAPNVKAYQMYKYIITNVGGPGNNNSQHWERTDARALQVQSSNAASAGYVVPTINQSSRPSFNTPSFDSFILYQLHVGSFAGRNDIRSRPIVNNTAIFLDTIDKLSYIKKLGFNGIALLPIGDLFDDLQIGGINAGYSGTCDMFAPEDAYATTNGNAVKELQQLIDQAHTIGLAVIFDVVYNHSAYTDNRYWQYDGNCYGANSGGEYHNGSHDTRFGSGFGMWQQEVKDFFLDNARMFLGMYQADGLRFDATQFIQPDALEYITSGLYSEFPNKYLIAEYNPGDPQSAAGPLDPYLTLGFSATWDLAGPGTAYNMLSGTDPVNNLLTLIGNFQNPDPWCSVRYLAGSHDQIFDSTGGNIGCRYIVERFGGRLNGWALAKGRIAWALTVCLPGTPMLFMGTDGNVDGWWDPQMDNGDHRVDWSQMGDTIGSLMQQMVTDINNLRWLHPALRSPAGAVTHLDYVGQVVAFKRYTLDGDLLLVIVNVSDNQWALHDYGVQMGGESGNWTEIFNSQSPAYGGVNTTGNYQETLAVSNNLLYLNLSSWSVVVLMKA